MKTRRRRINIDRYPDEELPDDCLRDGESLHVPIFMMDADQRAVTEHFDQQTVVDARLAAHRSTAGHRPGYVRDALTSQQNVNDVSYDLHSRTGTWWPEATKLRDEAYAATVQRQQWRDATPDNQNRNQSGQGEAMGRYSWTPEQLAVLKQACDILGITVPEDSYAPFENLYQRLTGLGPVGSMGGNPAGATRTGGNLDAAVAARDAAFADLQRRSENAWRGAR
jgi:hypothetical protein